MIIILILLGAILYAISPTVFFWVVGGYLALEAVGCAAFLLKVLGVGLYHALTEPSPSQTPSQHPEYKQILKDEEP